MSGGPFDIRSLVQISTGAGIQTDFGIWTPPGSRVVYVSATARADNRDIRRRTVTSVANALNYVRANQGDVIACLPGHTETVTTTFLSGMVAGTTIQGFTDPNKDDAPTFTWDAVTGATWAISAKNVTLKNLRLLANTANGHTKAINVTAAGFQMLGCYFDVAAGAALKSAIALELGEGATDALIAGNFIHGTETHNVTDGIKFVGSSAPNHRCRIIRNVMIASATAANGLVHVTTACKRLYIAYNSIYNTHTSSTACVKLDDVASDGIVEYNMTACMNDGVGTAQGVVYAGTTNCTVKSNQNYQVDEKGKSGVLSPAVVAT